MKKFIDAITAIMTDYANLQEEKDKFAKWWSDATLKNNDLENKVRDLENKVKELENKVKEFEDEQNN